MAGTGCEVVFVGLLPPPIDGQRLATARMREAIGAACAVRVCNVGPDPPQATLAKLARFARAAAALVSERVRGVRALYLAPHSGQGLWLAAALAGLARALGYRTHVHLHTFTHLVRRTAAMAAFCRLAGPAAEYVVLSPAMAERLATLYGVHRSSVVSNAALLTPAPRLDDDRVVPPLRLGHLSNLAFAKGLDTVLAVADELARRGVAFELVLAGPAPPAEQAAIDRAVARHPGQVRHAGALYGAAKEAWLRTLDAMLFPSRMPEASPLVLLEALRAGVPCFATPVGCIAEDVGPAGLVADPPIYVASVCERLERLAGDPALRARGRAVAQAQFERLRSEGCRALERVIGSLTRG